MHIRSICNKVCLHFPRIFPQMLQKTRLNQYNPLPVRVYTAMVNKAARGRPLLATSRTSITAGRLPKLLQCDEGVCQAESAAAHEQKRAGRRERAERERAVESKIATYPALLRLLLLLLVKVAAAAVLQPLDVAARSRERMERESERESKRECAREYNHMLSLNSPHNKW